jgi:SAM-dependent methyltransferase
VNIQDKYAQTEVVAFWARFAESGLQAAESAMIERYAPQPPARVRPQVLDIGCGAGRVTLALGPRGCDVVGIDITAAMVQAARELAAQKNVRGDFVQADLSQLSFANDYFDIALVFIAALQHVARRAARRYALCEIARILRKDGVLILALDNVAPALQCYASWALQKIRGQGTGGRGQLQTDLQSPTPDPQTADAVLASNRSRMNGLAWHARGLARTLRWRTWEGVRDAGRALRLVRGEMGDTFIHQVSMPPTGGKVYYHLYRHDELVTDAEVAGLQLLGYHSAHELAEGKTFGKTARRLDKQVMYAFGKVVIGNS